MERFGKGRAAIEKPVRGIEWLRHLACCLTPLVLVGGSVSAAIVSIPESDHFTISPFAPGFSLLESESTWFYGAPGLSAGQEELAQFPVRPVAGQVTLPVFLVDWSDFDPSTQTSNESNPDRVFPFYERSTPEELSSYLNEPGGVSDYFLQVSGGQLEVHFDVYPWIESQSSAYLKDRIPNYYFRQEAGQTWVSDRSKHAKDVLRAAVASGTVDLNHYDADGDQVLDGFVVVYEGYSGELAGTNIALTNGGWIGEGLNRPVLDSVNGLADEVNVAHAGFFSGPDILFNRYVNIPEMGLGGIHGASRFTPVAVWAHEIGHLLLGYRDYYLGESDLGYYALSARSGVGVPLHPAALEKWLFGKWVLPLDVSTTQTVELTNHHLPSGEPYETEKTYLARIQLRDDGAHYLTFEYRDFSRADEEGIAFNRDWNASSPESGVIIFEVNRHLLGADQIRRLLPDRIAGSSDTLRSGAFQAGDTFQYHSDKGLISVSDFRIEGEGMRFRVELPKRLEIVMEGSEIRLTFPATAGLNHFVEWSADVQALHWERASGGPFNSGEWSSVLREALPARFFRITTENPHSP